MFKNIERTLNIGNLNKFNIIGKYFRLFNSSACRSCPESEKNIKTTEHSTADIDRTKVISVDTSIRYLSSEAYKVTYGDQPVWVQYRRNHKGAIPPRKTRKTCIRAGVISTGSPCPICRDEFLVLDHKNLDLLKQFISPYTGQVLSYQKTGLCQKKHQQLLVTIERAKDRGLIKFELPFKSYDYSEYYEKYWNTQNSA